MPHRPLLIFPAPKLGKRSSLKPNFGGSLIKVPLHNVHVSKVSPLLHQLSIAFENKRVELLDSIDGADPEMVVVIEVVGSVDDFIKAVNKVEGLEWLGEVDIEDIAPDEIFYNINDPQKVLSGRMYLTMTNRRALEELLSLWNQYKNNELITFPRGFAKFKDVFKCLKNIRFWGVQDRLLETGILSVWQEDLEYDPQRLIRFEIELWYRKNSILRDSSTHTIRNLIQQQGGRVLSESVVEAISYHGLLAELPASSINVIIDSPETELVKCENIMLFRPVGQMITDEIELDEIELGDYQEGVSSLEEPLVALLDGLPLANHNLLNGRVIIDDPDEFESDYQASERVHGTSMASLILHGDLNDNNINGMSRPIYIRPIMKPMPSSHQRVEGVPDDVLVVDLIHRVVKRMFEGDYDELPSAPSIRIINLSIGDKYRQFSSSMSPLAKLLDWLSYKYRILFLVSTGNHSGAISFNISSRDFEQLEPAAKQMRILNSIFQNLRHKRILSPAESINSLTVGALHYDNSIGHNYRPSDAFNPFISDLPSPFSAFGSGYRRSVKPDIVFMGGKQFYKLKLGTNTDIFPAISGFLPGNKVATPGQSGDLNASRNTSGTSNATALITRAGILCFDSLKLILNQIYSDEEIREFEIPLLKSMLVHGASWGDIGENIKINLAPNKVSKSVISSWIGYGLPNIDKVLECTAQRATLIGFGSLVEDQGHEFSFPLPPTLASRAEWRRLTITLAWLAPINTSSQKYRIVNIWFEAPNKVAGKRSDADLNAARRGTIQHEIFEGEHAQPFVDGDVIKIKVNCRRECTGNFEAIPYGIIVSLEVKDSTNIPIYEEIKNRINIEIRTQVAII